MNPNNQNPHDHPQPPLPPQPPAEFTVPVPLTQPLHASHYVAPKPTAKSRAKLVTGLLITGAIIAGIIFLISKSPGAVKANLEKNGTPATAISTGKAFVFNERQSKYSRKVTYRAYYTYTATDGREYNVHGDKDYESEENVAAKKGMKADIKYSIDDPYHPAFITEQ